MSLMPVPFSTKSRYVKLILTKLKKQNRFKIEECEEVIEIEDFFKELLLIIEDERKNRQKTITL